MRKTKEEAELTRQTLLRAALVVFSRQGYAETRLEDIAAEAGVTRGAIYHHFGGKAELYNTLVAEATGRVLPVIEAAIAEGGTTLVILRRLFVRTLLYAAQDDDYRAVNEIVLFKTSVSDELASGMALKIDGTRQTVAYFEQMIAQGIAAGDIRADVDARDAALALIALQNGLLMLWLLDRDLFDLAGRAAALAEIYVRGIAA
jgi:TetR/AcrR family acrAB operon transcriptional repressor